MSDNLIVENNDWRDQFIKVEKKNKTSVLSISNIMKNSIPIFKDKDYKKVLDIGCGRGRNSFFYADHDFEVSALDTSKGLIDLLNNKIERLEIGNINTFVGDFKELPFENEFFDAIVCTSTLHHAKYSEIQQGVNEIRRVLKTEGCIILDLLSKEDESYGCGEKVEENTYIGSRKNEEGIIHYYADLGNIRELFQEFNQVKIYKNNYKVNIFDNREVETKLFDIIAYK